MAAFNATPRLTLAAMAALCLAAVGAALVSQHVFDMRPCPWCILQRVIFVGIALLCIVGALLPSAARALAALAGLLALSGAASLPSRLASSTFFASEMAFSTLSRSASGILSRFSVIIFSAE